MAAWVLALLLQADIGREASRQVARQECEPVDGNEIVVCGSRKPGERYRLPGRDGPFDPVGDMDSVMRERQRWVEDGDAGVQSCSAVGPGGWTGCMVKEWKRQRDQTQWGKNVPRGADAGRAPPAVRRGIGCARRRHGLGFPRLIRGGYFSMKFAVSTALALALAATAPASAQDKPAEKPKAAQVKEVVPQIVTTMHSGTFGGQRMRYSATIGETILKNKDGVPQAAVVTTAYVKEPRDPNRPVFFLFNGGPGSGSLWLQMGAFGPKRVAIPSDARDDGAPPYPIVDNPDSLLDVADLVFIDPPGTGFSHLIGDADPKDFYGVTQDAKAVAEVIRRWLNDNGRWNSPKYLGGESYGTTRSAAVVNQLEGATYNDVALNGVILISTVLDFGAGSDAPGNELSYITNLPSMAATALYHGKATAPSTEQFVEEAKAWAIGPYASALLKGQRISPEEHARIRTQLARFTGLSEEYLEQANLRVTPSRFYKELLRDRGLTIGRLDARYTGRDYDNAGETPDNDPSFYGIDAGYTAAMNAWARGPLGFMTDREYQSIAGLGRDWDWRIGGRDDNAYLNVTPYLGRALRENSGLRIFVGQGWYDFATPFFAAEYALTRTGIPQDRIVWSYYDSGHMMYVRDEDRSKLSADIRSFIRGL